MRSFDRSMGSRSFYKHGSNGEFMHFKALLLSLFAGLFLSPAQPNDPTCPSKPQTTQNAVDWRAVVQQSAMFTGIQHAFRFGTEPGTRSAMNGPFWKGYIDSIDNLHGWSDGDQFYVNYVGHPIQGAVSGFIYLQNDPQARLIRFGRDPRYWRSRLKAMGVAWAYSTWFEIGPVSEASLGNIQSRRPRQGFVDHVLTPMIGTGWLNPSRSFSNALRFKAPWYRDSLGGILDGYRPPLVMEPEARRAFPSAAPVAVTALPYWARFEGTQCAGAGGQAAFRLSPSWQPVGQLNGCQLRDQAPNVSADSLTYAIGPRWVPAAERPVSPFAQVLVGGNKVPRHEADPVRERLLQAEARQLGREMPPLEPYSKTEYSHAFVLAAGTGVDIRLNSAFAFRLASVEYARSWAAKSYSQGLQLSTGVILRMGTWCFILNTVPLAGRSFNGRTADSDSAYRGSNPCLPATLQINLGPRDSFRSPNALSSVEDTMGPSRQDASRA